jgi:hypothetical protein
VALGAWRPTPGDLGLQVLEWWAYIGDILTFYNERVANEDYLRTSQFPPSVAGLVALLGYQPAPGLAAVGQIAAVRGHSHLAEPLVLPEGMQIVSSASAAVPAQIFEVTAETTYSGTTDVVATLPPNPALDVTSTGPNSVLLAGKVTGVKVGDRLVLAAAGWSGGDDNWSLVTVAAVGPETDPGTGAVNTRVTFAAANWGTAPPTGASGTKFHIWKTFAVEPATFLEDHVVEDLIVDEALHWWVRGGAAQQTAQSTRAAASYQLMKPTATATLWDPNVHGANPSAAIEDNGTSANLSTTVRNIHAGDLVLFDGGTAQASVLCLVFATQDNSGTMPFPGNKSTPPPDIVLPFTALSLVSNDSTTVSSYSANPTPVAVRYGFRPVGTVISNPVGTLPSLPAQVDVPVSFSLPAGVSSAFLVDANSSAALVGVAPDGTGSLALTAAPSTSSAFEPPLAAPLKLYFDLVPVARGVTVATEVLGSGNAIVAGQSFPLQKSPLTYVASGAGWASTLKVYVDGVEWTEVPTLFGQPPSAQVYVIDRAPDQTASVRFGDGVAGSRLTTGSGNIVATYRYGSGAASPPAGRLTTAINTQPNLASIQNPVAVSPGKDPQAPANVKTDAPASVLCFGRAISAVDYEVIAGQAAGVTRVRAYWTLDPAQQRNLVKIYVNNDDGGVQTAQVALTGADDPNRPVVVSAAIGIDVYISCKLVVDQRYVIDDVVAAATASIGDPMTGAFSPSRMGIGQWLYRSYVDAALSVAGVVGVEGLRVTWVSVPAGKEMFRILRRLDNVADPGEGAYFDLPSANLSIAGRYSDD